MKTSIIGTILRGMAMGAADVVPGVSGGTMALITGIYERLIAAVGAITKEGLSTLRKEGLNMKGLRATWQAIDATFLVSLGVGIAVSVLTFARIIGWALEEYPPVVWAFFFGLIVASTWYVAKMVKHWKWQYLAFALVSAAVLVAISLATPAATPEAPWFVLLSGMIAISAMILPGISGSFLLVLLGKYEYVLNAIHDMNLTVIVVFGAGCAIGILTSARIISWFFKKYHDATMAAILGVMVGSLYTVWPWRQVTRFSGEFGTEDYQVLTDQPVLPSVYDAQSIVGLESAQPSYVIFSVIAGIIGVLLVFAITSLAHRKQ